MPNITLTFPNPINVSVQVGDIAYYLNDTRNLGLHIHSDQEDIVQIGKIESINRNLNTMLCNWDPNPTWALFPTSDKFIMFSKDNKVNLSSILGYYAEVKFTNNSPDEAELFSVGTEIFGSSK
tara:strand:+ start:132 stop:500 length:369 start_codon:yes stop_codon:yes gene_type:complete